MRSGHPHVLAISERLRFAVEHPKDGLSRPLGASTILLPKAELLAKCGQAQERAIDFYGVIYATRRVAVPANELRFPAANGASSIPSFLLVRARHVFAPPFGTT